MGGILSRAEGSPKASQNARQSVLGSIDLVSTCVDYLVVDELYGSARPVCTAWRAAADLTPGRLSLDGSAQIFGAPNGRHFTVRDLLDAMVKHEKRLMRFPTGHAHFVGLRQHERWPAMYYVVWEWYPDEGEPFLIE